MEKQIFKVGDRVFDIRFGWGEIILYFGEEPFPNYMCARVKFDDENIGKQDYTYREAVLLSFTEYTLDGFSQERPINYEDYMGKWGKFTNEYGFFIDKLKSFGSYGKNSNKFFFRAEVSNKELYEFEPLTDEQIKILGLE